MVSTEEPQPDDLWRFRDPQALERQLELIFGEAPGLQAWKQSVLETFAHALQAHPREWPAASAPPSEHSFRFYGIEIRYRVFPSDQSVEVLSVTSLRPRDPHPQATRTI